MSSNSSDEIMKQKYLDREQARIDRKSAIYYAEQKGIEKGRMLTAKNLLVKNIDINVIADATGISIDQLEKIKEQL